MARKWMDGWTDGWMSRSEIRVERRLRIPNSAETAVWWPEEDPRCTANVVRDSSRARRRGHLF